MVSSKKNELFDQLLNSIEEEESGTGHSPRTRPIWIILIDYYYEGDGWRQPGPISEEDKVNLTRYFRRNEIPRIIKNIGGCRDYAIESRENWMQIIPDGKQLLLDHAKKNSDTEFLEAIRKFETRR